MRRGRLREKALTAAERYARSVDEQKATRLLEWRETASRKAGLVLRIAPPDLALPPPAERTNRVVGEEWVFQEDGMDFVLRTRLMPKPLGRSLDDWNLFVRTSHDNLAFVSTLAQLGCMIETGKVVALDGGD